MPGHKKRRSRKKRSDGWVNNRLKIDKDPSELYPLKRPEEMPSEEKGYDDKEAMPPESADHDAREAAPAEKMQPGRRKKPLFSQ